MAQVVKKTFEDLIKEVHEKGLCGECGGCVSFCSAGDLKAIEMSIEGPPKYANKDKCLKCGICYYVCPQTHVLNDQLNSKYDNKPPMGNQIKVSSAQATSDEIRERGTDGGVVTAILTYMLENKLIDGAIVSKRLGPFNRVSYFATTKEDLIEAAGSHFDTSKQVIGLESYNTFIAANIQLQKLKNSDLLNIALVGTPCQINSIRKMQELQILPAHIVKYTLGLFCYLNFSFNDEDRKKMEEQFNFSFSDVDSFNIRDKMILTLKNGNSIHIDLKNLHEFGRQACFACSDFSNVYADLSFGGIGSPEKHTTVVIRTKTGEKLYKEALNKGFIKEPPNMNSKEKKAEMLNIIKNFCEAKIERAKKTLQEKQ